MPKPDIRPYTPVFSHASSLSEPSPPGVKSGLVDTRDRVKMQFRSGDGVPGLSVASSDPFSHLVSQRPEGEPDTPPNLPLSGDAPPPGQPPKPPSPDTGGEEMSPEPDRPPLSRMIFPEIPEGMFEGEEDAYAQRQLPTRETSAIAGPHGIIFSLSRSHTRRQIESEILNGFAQLIGEGTRASGIFDMIRRHMVENDAYAPRVHEFLSLFSTYFDTALKRSSRSPFSDPDSLDSILSAGSEAWREDSALWPYIRTAISDLFSRTQTPREITDLQGNLISQSIGKEKTIEVFAAGIVEEAFFSLSERVSRLIRESMFSPDPSLQAGTMDVVDASQLNIIFFGEDVIPHTLPESLERRRQPGEPTGHPVVPLREQRRIMAYYEKPYVDRVNEIHRQMYRHDDWRTTMLDFHALIASRPFGLTMQRSALRDLIVTSLFPRALAFDPAHTIDPIFLPGQYIFPFYRTVDLEESYGDIIDRQTDAQTIAYIQRHIQHLSVLSYYRQCEGPRAVDPETICSGLAHLKPPELVASHQSLLDAEIDDATSTLRRPHPLVSFRGDIVEISDPLLNRIGLSGIEFTYAGRGLNLAVTLSLGTQRLPLVLTHDLRLVNADSPNSPLTVSPLTLSFWRATILDVLCDLLCNEDTHETIGTNQPRDTESGVERRVPRPHPRFLPPGYSYTEEQRLRVLELSNGEKDLEEINLELEKEETGKRMTFVWPEEEEEYLSARRHPEPVRTRVHNPTRRFSGKLPNPAA